MDKQSRGKMVTVLLSEDDRHHHRSLAEALVDRAREEGLSAATVLQGIGGYGPTVPIGSAQRSLADGRLPLVVHIVDEASRVEAFLPVLQAMTGEALVVVEDVQLFGRQEETLFPLDDA